MAAEDNTAIPNDITSQPNNFMPNGPLLNYPVNIDYDYLRSFVNDKEPAEDADYV